MTKTTFYCDQCHKEITNGMAFSGNICNLQKIGGPSLSASINYVILSQCSSNNSVWCSWECMKKEMDVQVLGLSKFAEERNVYERESPNDIGRNRPIT